MVEDRKAGIISHIPAHDLALGYQNFFQMDQRWKMGDRISA